MGFGFLGGGGGSGSADFIFMGARIFLKLEASKTLYVKAFRASKIASTKARLLKHDFPVHGFAPLWFFLQKGRTYCCCRRHEALAAQKSYRKIAVTTVAESGLATIPLQKPQSFSLRWPPKNRNR